jgi:Flp pilus assembly protein TadD
MFPKRRLSHARGYLELGMVAEAAAELAQIAAPDAESTEALTLKIAVLHEQENWPGVRDLARELIRRDAADAAVWVTLAYATRRIDSLVAAEIILIKAEKVHPDEPTIQFNLGCYACQQGNLKEARRRVDRAIELDPKFQEIAATDPDLAPLRAAEAGGLPPTA